MLNYNPTKFNGHSLSSGGDRSGDKTFLVCHAILQDNVIISSCDFMVGGHVHCDLAKLGDQRVQ